MGLFFDDQTADAVVIFVMFYINFAIKAVIAFKAEELLSVREYFINGESHTIFLSLFGGRFRYFPEPSLQLSKWRICKAFQSDGERERYSLYGSNRLRSHRSNSVRFCRWCFRKLPILRFHKFCGTSFSFSFLYSVSGLDCACQFFCSFESVSEAHVFTIDVNFPHIIVFFDFDELVVSADVVRTAHASLELHFVFPFRCVPLMI